MRPIRTSLLAAAVALGLSACGVSDPYNDSGAERASTPTATPTSTPEPTPTTPPGMVPPSPDDPEPDPVELDVGDLPATPRDVIARYVELVGNWDHDTVKEQYRAAVAITVDAARTDVETVATEIDRDPRYDQTEVRQRTALEGVMPSGDDDQYLVVTRRAIQMEDSVPSRAWVVTLVTLEDHDGRWAIKRWEEQT